MTGRQGSLERALEGALMLGVLTSGALLVAGLGTGRADLLRAGVVMLMLTPIARVAVLTGGLAWQRDWAFVALSLWILGVLLSSLRLARLW
jgi:uncharacterized membrane protein